MCSAGNDSLLDLAVDRFRVASLNVWGLAIAYDLQERMQAIGTYFGGDNAVNGLDAVLMQELWREKDYETVLKPAMQSTFPHSHYFPSGVVGAGLVTWSKWPIAKVSFKPYTAQGRADHVFQGDWFAGKGVGLCVLEHPVLGPVYLYNTHTVADYSDSPPSWFSSGGGGVDIYANARIAQIQEALEWVDQTCAPDAKVVILGGDFNTEPGGPGFHYTLDMHALMDKPRNGWLQEAWSKITTDPTAYATANRSDNIYTTLGKSPKRLDTFLFNQRWLSVADMQLILVEETIESKATGAFINYSDHAGILATFIVHPLAKNQEDAIAPKNADDGDGCCTETGAEISEETATEITALIQAVDAEIKERQATASWYGWYVFVLVCFVILTLLWCGYSLMRVKGPLSGLSLALLVLTMIWFFNQGVWVLLFELWERVAIVSEISVLRQIKDSWSYWLASHTK